MDNGVPGPVMTLSEGGTDASRPGVAIDPLGHATVVWRVEDGEGQRIQAIHVGAGGNQSAVVTLSESGALLRDSALDVDAQGRATVAWVRDGVVEVTRLWLDCLPPEVLAVSDPGDSVGRVDVGVNDAGQAAVVWDRLDGGSGLVELAHVSAEGALGSVDAVSGSDDANAPSVAIDAEGRVTVAWRATSESILEIRSVRMAADGAPAATKTLDWSDGYVSRPRLEINDTGRVILAWATQAELEPLGPIGDPDPMGPTIPPMRVRTARIDEDGIASMPLSLALVNGAVHGPELAVDGQGVAHVVWGAEGWVTCTALGCPVPGGPVDSRIRSALISAEGVPYSLDALSGNDSAPGWPAVAVGAQGDATVAWRAYDAPTYRVRAVQTDGMAAGSPAKLGVCGRPGSPPSEDDDGPTAQPGWRRATAVAARRVRTDGHHARVSIRCVGEAGTRCRGSLRLLRRGRHGGWRMLGAGRFSLAAGGRSSVRFRLTRVGRRVVAARGPIHARLVGVGVTHRRVLIR